MTKKIYIKDTSFDPIYREVSKGFYARTRVIPSLLVFSGLFVFATQVLLPLVVFKTQDDNIALIDNATVLGRAAGFSKFEYSELQKTKAEPIEYKNRLGDGSVTFLEGEYFPIQNQDVKDSRAENIPEYFYITIPKLKINGAKVESNAKSLDPSKALGHYRGTELPGEIGNAFIYGHSVLPWFFNPNNYKTIFSTLNMLVPGDYFYVKVNNNEYKYVVELKEELVPSKVNPLAETKPRYLNESTITLMTCSPPGTRLKRLLVYAVLEKN